MRELIKIVAAAAVIYSLPLFAGLSPTLLAAWTVCVAAVTAVIVLQEYRRQRSQNAAQKLRSDSPWYPSPLHVVENRAPSKAEPREPSPSWDFEHAYSENYPPASWLKERITLDEAEEEFPWFRNQDVFGRGIAWREGDEIWRFSSPKEQWMALAGRGGIALIRDGRCVGHVLTSLS